MLGHVIESAMRYMRLRPSSTLNINTLALFPNSPAFPPAHFRE